MADLRAKALGYLRAGAVTVGAARRPKDSDHPDFVSAKVEGHNGRYYVHLLDGRWTCSCKAVVDDGQDCAHLAAVQLVTGHESAAAKVGVS